MVKAREIDAKEIKKEPESYKISVLRLIDKLNTYIYHGFAGKKSSVVQGVAGTLLALEAMIYPFTTKKYKEEREKLLPKIKNLERKIKLDNKNYRKLYMETLIEWYKLIIGQLNQIDLISKPRKRLVSMSKSDFVRLGEEIFGKGKVKVMFLEDEDDDDEIDPILPDAGGFSFIGDLKESEKIIEDFETKKSNVTESGFDEVKS